MDESRLELKVGALALVALAVALALLAAVRGFPSSQGFTFHVDFGYAGGLPSGALVKIAGVKVGRVREVQFRPTARDDQGRAVPVRLVLDIDPATAPALRADATAAVGTQGALGESFVELLPGDASAPLSEGSAVRGLDPPRLDLLLARLFSVFEGAANDEAFRRFLTSVARLAGTFDTILEQNRPEIRALFENLGATMTDAREAVHEVRVAARAAAVLLADDDLPRLLHDAADTARVAKSEVPALAEETRALLARLDKLAGAVGPEEVAHLRSTLARLDATGAQVQRIATSIEALLAKIDRGEGTLGGFVKDPQAYHDLRSLLADLKQNPWKFLWKP
jgi:phospholipid/cholesterol/gamma-HCH transport system substrate-binding protein